MMRKSEYYTKVNLYLEGELTGEELAEFEVDLLFNQELAEELRVQKEVHSAIQEKEIMDLRKNMQSVMRGEHANEDISSEFEESDFAHMEYHFLLSNETASYDKFFQTIRNDEINELPHSLPRMHMFQHGIAEKENVHFFYKEQLQETDAKDDFLSSPMEEQIFEDLRKALHEKDIQDLRTNLSQIAADMPEYQWDIADIDRYLAQELSPDEQLHFENDMQVNQLLNNEVKLHRELDTSIQERDVMDLRSSLKEMMEVKSTDVVTTQDIDHYLNNELEGVDLAAFEDKLDADSSLALEVEMYKEVDLALKETEIMRLRSNLQAIGDNVVKEKQRSVRMPLSRTTIATIAASLAILLSVAGIFSRKDISDSDLYRQYYRPYQSVGVVRSGNAIADNKLNAALLKFNNQEYDSALTLFQQVIASSDSETPVGHFYSGLSYQETGRFSQAIEEYKVVVKENDNLFVEQAEWYIGLCYLQTQERKKAYKQLKKIAKGESYYSEKADAIIRKLKYKE